MKKFAVLAASVLLAAGGMATLPSTAFAVGGNCTSEMLTGYYPNSSEKARAKCSSLTSAKFRARLECAGVDPWPDKVSGWSTALNTWVYTGTCERGQFSRYEITRL